MNEGNELKATVSIMPWFQEAIKRVAELAEKLVTEHGMPADAAKRWFVMCFLESYCQERSISNR